MSCKKQILWGFVFILLFSSCGQKKIEQSLMTYRLENQKLKKSIEGLSNKVLYLEYQLEDMQLKKIAAQKEPKFLSEEFQKVKPKNQKPTFLTQENIELKTSKGLNFTNNDLSSYRLRKQKNSPGKSKRTKQAIAPIKDTDTISDEEKKITKKYNQAFQLFKSQKYDAAEKEWNEFVGLYPNHEYTDNSIYWLGESYERRGQCDKAIQYYNRVIQSYSDGNKVPDALYRSAKCYTRLSNYVAAQRMLNQLQNKYAQSLPAKRARRELSQKK